MRRCFKFLFLVFLFFGSLLLLPQYVSAATDDGVTLLVSPPSGTVLVGSTFDVSVFLDTEGKNVNTVVLKLKFPPDKLTIVRPSGGQSFFSIWPEAPVFSNTEGTMEFIGGVPGGITTERGLVTTITFKAKKTGQAVVEIMPSSKVLANDGRGTDILSRKGRATYNIQAIPPGGVKVFSETHPFEDLWYNNKNPILTWEKDAGITDFSFTLDNKPLTIPNNISDTKDTIKSYEDLADGLWYFHIKAKKDDIWGSTTHYLILIDATPPASFKPTVEILTAAVIDRALVSFFTTDALSGIDHYEVGVIDKNTSPLDSPVFVETQSPYQVPNLISGDLRIIVRAVDRVGNVRDESIDIYLPLSKVVIFGIILAIFLLLIVFHYLFGHRLLARFKRAFTIVNQSN